MIAEMNPLHIINTLISSVYEQHGLMCTSFPVVEVEGAAYGACHFALNGSPIRFRIAKITPTKNGQFVTLWQRSLAGKIVPFDAGDSIDFFVANVRDGDHYGQFIFSKQVLISKGIISQNGKGGKLAIRVYPPWVVTQSKQATQTQKWQLLYFLDLTDKSINTILLKQLFSSII